MHIYIYTTLPTFGCSCDVPFYNFRAYTTHCCYHYTPLILVPFTFTCHWCSLLYVVTFGFTARHLVDFRLFPLRLDAPLRLRLLRVTHTVISLFLDYTHGYGRTRRLLCWFVYYTRSTCCHFCGRCYVAYLCRLPRLIRSCGVHSGLHGYGSYSTHPHTRFTLRSPTPRCCRSHLLVILHTTIFIPVTRYVQRLLTPFPTVAVVRCLCDLLPRCSVDLRCGIPAGRYR